MSNHARFLKEAIDLSLSHMRSGHGGPFGAVIVKNGQVIGRGWNKVTSSNDPTAHAEVSAIRNACENIENYKLEGATIYTSCEPCPMCLSAIYWARIDKIYYANSRQDAAEINFDDEFLYQEVSKDPSDRQIPMVQLLRDEAFAVFKEWDDKQDKTPY